MTSRIVAIVMVGVTVISVVVAIRWQPQPLGEMAEPQAVVVELRTDELEWRSGAMLELSVDSGGRLLSNGRPGLVTEIFVQPGVRVASGDPIVAVDGSIVRGLATRTPLYRTIQRGSRGADVVDLQQALLELSLYDGEINGEADTTTMDAVAAFLGVEPQRSLTIAPDDVIWLPVADLPISSVDIEVGAPLPPLGTPVVTAPATLARASISLTNGSGRELHEDDLVFESLDGTLRIPLDGDLSPTNLESVEAAMTRDETVEAGTTASTSTIQGVVRSTVQRQVLVVPTAAVVVDLDSICVWLADDIPHPNAVRVVGSSAVGVTYLEHVNLDGRRVIANPTDVGLGSCSA